MVSPVPARRFRVEHHADEAARLIIVHVFQEPGVKRRYLGQLNITVTTPRGPMQRIHPFSIKAESVDEAFDLHDETARAEIQRLRAPKKPKIVTATAMPPAGPGADRLKGG